MSLILKDPGATVDYEIDWGADYLGEDVLVASLWTADPDESGGVRVMTDQFDDSVARASISGGEAGKLYRLQNEIETADGRRDSRSIMVRVEKR